MTQNNENLKSVVFSDLLTLVFDNFEQHVEGLYPEKSAWSDWKAPGQILWASGGVYADTQIPWNRASTIFSEAINSNGRSLVADLSYEAERLFGPGAGPEFIHGNARFWDDHYLHAFCGPKEKMDKRDTPAGRDAPFGAQSPASHQNYKFSGFGASSNEAESRWPKFRV